MSELLAGAATTNITPPLGTYLAGYYRPRQAKGVHDELWVRTLCLRDGDESLAIAACDLVSLPQDTIRAVKERITRLCGLQPEQVLVGCSHTHTGPETRSLALWPVDEDYLRVMANKIADSVALAHERLAPAELAWGVGHEETLSFNRRYWMRDGTLRTNPGVGNPDIVRPAGPIDPEVGVVAVRDKTGRLLAIWVNFALHLDTTGGSHISADYPFYLTEALRKRFGPDLVVLFSPGAMGDINHIDVNAVNQPVKGESHPSRIGNTLAGEALKVLARSTYSSACPLAYDLTEVALPLRQVTRERAAEAEKIVERASIGKADFTLDVVAARRDRDLGQLGSTLTVPVQALRVGDIAIVGVPGELFVELGLTLKQESPFTHTFVAELANGGIGYIPTRKAYDEGGYEATSTVLAPGSGEQLVEAGLSLLNSLAAS